MGTAALGHAFTPQVLSLGVSITGVQILPIIRRFADPGGGTYGGTGGWGRKGGEPFLQKVRGPVGFLPIRRLAYGTDSSTVWTCRPHPGAGAPKGQAQLDPWLCPALQLAGPPPPPLHLPFLLLLPPSLPPSSSCTPPCDTPPPPSKSKTHRRRSAAPVGTNPRNAVLPSRRQ